MTEKEHLSVTRVAILLHYTTPPPAPCSAHTRPLSQRSSHISVIENPNRRPRVSRAHSFSTYVVRAYECMLTFTADGKQRMPRARARIPRARARMRAPQPSRRDTRSKTTLAVPAGCLRFHHLGCEHAHRLVVAWHCDRAPVGRHREPRHRLLTDGIHFD